MGGEIYCRGTRRRGKSGASSGCRWPRTSSRRSACARPSTCSPRAGRRQRHARARHRQSLRPHDRDVGLSLAEGEERRRVGFAGGPDRNEHAARHAANPKLQSLDMEPSLSVGRGMHADRGLLHPDALDHEPAARPREPDDPRTRSSATIAWPPQPAGVPDRAHDARRPPLRDHQRSEGAAARAQDRFAHAGQGSRHHHPGRHRAQRGPAEPGAGRGRVADGPHQRRDRDRRRQDPQVEGPAARRRSARICAGSSKPRATTSSPRPAFHKTCSAATESARRPRARGAASAAPRARARRERYMRFQSPACSKAWAAR